MHRYERDGGCGVRSGICDGLRGSPLRYVRGVGARRRRQTGPRDRHTRLAARGGVGSA